MEITEAYKHCQAKRTSGTEEFWSCVQKEICGSSPSIGCQILIAALRFANPTPHSVPTGDFFSARGLKAKVAQKLRQLHTDLIQPGAVVQPSAILDAVHVLQEAGMQRRALQGLEIINRIEALSQHPQFDLLSRAQELRAISLDAIGSRRAAVESRVLATILARAANR